MELWTLLEHLDLVISVGSDLYTKISEHRKNVNNTEADTAKLYRIDDEALSRLSNYIINNQYSLEYTENSKLIPETKRSEYLNTLFKMYPELIDRETTVKNAVDYYFDDLEKRLSDILTPEGKIIVKKIDDSKDEVIDAVKDTEKIISDKIDNVVSALNKITIQEADAEKVAADTEESCINIYLKRTDRYYCLDADKTNINFISWHDQVRKHNGKINVIMNDYNDIRQILAKSDPNSGYAKDIYFVLEALDKQKKLLSDMLEYALKDINVFNSIESVEDFLNGCIRMACGACASPESNEIGLDVYTGYGQQKLYFIFFVPKDSIDDSIKEDLWVPYLRDLIEIMDKIHYPNLMERSILPGYLLYSVKYYKEETLSKLSPFTLWYVSFH